jgi:hypothetical protein
MTSISISSAQQQLTLQFEPRLIERYPTLRAYMAHRVQVQDKPAKTIAADMDMSPSLLSRKLTPSDGDTQRFNIDDLEAYIQATGDTAMIGYLAAKYLHSDEARRAQALADVEQRVVDLARLIQTLKGGA